MGRYAIRNFVDAFQYGVDEIPDWILEEIKMGNFYRVTDNDSRKVCFNEKIKDGDFVYIGDIDQIITVCSKEYFYTTFYKID